jgi:hypothetical protein
MNKTFAKWNAALFAVGLALLMVSGCSKEKKEDDAVVAPPATPAVEQTPAPVPEATPAMKEPVEVAPKGPTVPATKPAAVGGAATVRARFDGYAARVSKNLWQPVLLAAEVANYALISPLESVSAGSGLVVEGGPENLALGTVSGMLKTAEGRPLLAGQEYTFTFRKDTGDLWSVDITPAR